MRFLAIIAVLPSSSQLELTARLAVPAAVPMARAPVLRMMHSDSRPTREYMDFLLGIAGADGADSEDCPSIIVGDGRVGGLLADFGARRGYDDILVKRGDPIPELQAGGQLVRKPIYICTRSEDLDAVLGACPKERWEDLVFMQNGQLEPFRQRYALYETTQAILWFAAMRKGAKPKDGITSEAPEGLSCVSGKWSGALKMRLGTGNLACSTVNHRDLRRNMLEKLVWISSFMLVGAVHGGITVGEVAEKHEDEVRDMIRELASFCRFTLSVALKTGLEDRLLAYSKTVDFFPTAIKEFEFRNGYFYRFSLMAGKRTNAAGITVDMPDSTPMHTEYLLAAVERGVLSKAELNSVAPIAK